jgi:hypothetical protein
MDRAIFNEAVRPAGSADEFEGHWRKTVCRWRRSDISAGSI